MSASVVTAISMAGGFMLLLLLLRHKKKLATSWKPAVFLSVAELVLFFALCLPRKVHWFSLPGGWLLCLIPLAIYSFFLQPPHLMGQKFLFGASIFVYLFIPFSLSLILGIIFFALSN